jgi:ribosome-binding protein aMBF1 (putative translation factor)
MDGHDASQRYHRIVQSWTILDPSQYRHNTHTIPISRDAPQLEEDVSVDANAAMSSFALTLQKQRIRCRLSLQGLARRAMLDVNIIAQYERGEMDPSEEMERFLLRLLESVYESQQTAPL